MKKVTEEKPKSIQTPISIDLKEKPKRTIVTKANIDFSKEKLYGVKLQNEIQKTPKDQTFGELSSEYFSTSFLL